LNGFTRNRVTATLIGLNLIVFLAQISSGGAVTAYLALIPQYVFQMPWTIITSGFAHDPSNYLHIILNMYSLWIIGQSLEPILGAKRFFWVYMLSLIGGSLAFIFFNPNDYAVGASGAIFGLMGALFVAMRALGYRSSQLLTVIAINVGIGIFMPGIALSAHLGGLVVGAGVTYLMIKARR
jgi:membrane associated rhomboid family serine protease